MKITDDARARALADLEPFLKQSDGMKGSTTSGAEVLGYVAWKHRSIIYDAMSETPEEKQYRINPPLISALQQREPVDVEALKRELYKEIPVGYNGSHAEIEKYNDNISDVVDHLKAKGYLK